MAGAAIGRRSVDVAVSRPRTAVRAGVATSWAIASGRADGPGDVRRFSASTRWARNSVAPSVHQGRPRHPTRCSDGGGATLWIVSVSSAVSRLIRISERSGTRRAADRRAFGLGVPESQRLTPVWWCATGGSIRAANARCRRSGGGRRFARAPGAAAPWCRSGSACGRTGRRWGSPRASRLRAGP